MKKYFSQARVFTFLILLLFGTACNGPIEKNVPKEKGSESNILAVAHPKLIKTIGSPKYGNVQSTLKDKAGNLWFGTTENGLYKYDGKSFTQFLVSDGLNSNNINALLEDKDGKIWIGTPVGVCLYDGKTFTKIQIPLLKNLPPNKFKKTQEVFSIMQDKSRKLWFATIDGVYIYDGKSFTPFIINEGGVGYMSSNNNVEYILEDKAGNIWFGGRGNKGVFRYDGKSITNLKPNGDNWAWPALQDKNGNIWFSNWSGAYLYDGKSFTSFTKNDGLLSDSVMRIIEDKNGNIWFGGGGGICRYDGNSFTCFTTKNGLINQGIWAILEDKTGNLWIGTRETGLYLYDGKTFINYSEYKH
ncbi:ligand-binding sensor domain-containing protein [Flavobacterium sp. LS1P3]|uniref:ligand-binding sensor domain-containing protein n=1 Tax=Flavobacterium sp. LS1P3 TaxID=3401720 RepID=UPI003AAC9C4B